MILLTAAVSNSLDRSTSRRVTSSQVNRDSDDESENENEIIEMNHDIHNDDEGEGDVEEEDDDDDDDDGNNDNDDEEQEVYTRGNGTRVLRSHSSTATVTSSATSHTSSSSRSKKSRRSSMTSDRTIQLSLFPSYDPMHIVTKEQLKAFSLLVSTPIWIFDFIERKNKYSNLAGLELWSSPNLEEFLNRSMTDMSAAATARTQECQNRIERGQVVQEMWTFYPKGKAKTVQMSK
jgi:hypothetical protein